MKALKSVRNDSSSEIVFVHLNVNLFLVKQLKSNMDVLMILEIGDSFPIGNFLTEILLVVESYYI